MYGYRTKHKILKHYMDEVTKAKIKVPPPKILLTVYSKSIKGINENVAATYLPSDKVKYKLLLISSKLNDYAKSKMESAFDKNRIPFLYDKKAKKNIEIYVLSWAELIENNRRKLSYLSKHLKVKERSVKEKFETEYSELIGSKVKSILRRIS